MENEKQEKLTELPDVVEFCTVHNFPADIVGRWVWIRFESKPPAHERDLLKAAGFRWVKRRGEWAHNCGVVTGKGKCDPRFKYGAQPITARTRRTPDATETTNRLFS